MFSTGLVIVTTKTSPVALLQLARSQDDLGE